MPSSGHIIVESPSLIQAFARSLSQVDPLRRHRFRRTVICEFFRPGMRPTPRSRYASHAQRNAPVPEKAIQYP